MTGLDELPLAQRNDIRPCWARNGGRRCCCPPARWPSDDICLLFALRATGARPRPSLILIAYAVAGVVGMIPATPGGSGWSRRA